MATLIGQGQRYDPADAERRCDWPALLAEHRAVARRALRSVLGACTEEEDLLQEVALRLVARASQPGEISVASWTWRVAHNVAVDHRRKRSAFPVDVRSLDRPVGEGLDHDVIATEFAGAVNSAVQRLPDRQRDAVLMQAALDGTRGGHIAVADALGVSPKAAESILGRARRSLRRDLHLPLGTGVAAAWAFVRRVLRSKTAVVAIVTAAAVSAAVDMVAVPSWRLAPALPASGPPLVERVIAAPTSSGGAPTGRPQAAATTSLPSSPPTPTAPVQVAASPVQVAASPVPAAPPQPPAVTVTVTASPLPPVTVAPGLPPLPLSSLPGGAVQQAGTSVDSIVTGDIRTLPGPAVTAPQALGRIHLP
jgi:RNA polymerase sigma factor (sigma-70 family)